MNARDTVRAAWDQLASRHRCSRSAAQAVLDELVAAYAEPQRAYHTLDHIAALVRLLDQHRDAGTDRDALLLAILFHDVVYDPSRDDNETASARFAVSRMEGLGFAPATVARVQHLICATQHGAKSGEVNDTDLALLLDLDLSVLAAAPDVYRAYATAIRREYALYPDDVYKPGRRRVLEAFLARDRIYLTERLHAAWETSARQNLASEIADLT